MDGRSAHGRSARRISVAGKGLMLLTDAVQLVVGIRWSACAVQHAGQPARGARGVVAPRLAVVDRLIVSFFLFLWPRRGRNPATVWGETSLFRMCE